LRTDDPADIQAEVEQRLGTLEPDVEVLAVEIGGGPRSPTLRIFLDREGGVDLDLCARVTRHLRDLLREYTVEVSSPGPERPLTKLEHYRRFMGRRVRIRTREAIEGRRDFKGELIGADDRGISLAGEWGTVMVPHERIRRSNLVAQAPTGKIGRQK
jgi:ribosome maturation factor RimP